MYHSQNTEFDWLYGIESQLYHLIDMSQSLSISVSIRFNVLPCKTNIIVVFLYHLDLMILHYCYCDVTVVREKFYFHWRLFKT